MSRQRWHITVEGALLTLSRSGRVRLDVSAATRLPDGARARIAHQIRQDIWRAVQDQRGFSPVIQITRRDGGLDVEAGGQCLNQPTPRLKERIEAVLCDPAKRSRWIAHARRAEGLA